MYVKRHSVRRGDKRYVYLRVVEAFRTDSGQVRHRVLANLGREDLLKASGQLDQLAASFARLDPPALGTRRDVGTLLLVQHYLNKLELAKIIDQAVPMRGRAFLTHGEVISALVANRLSAPSPLYDVAGWASSSALAELLHTPAELLNDDRLGRALEALAPVAEQVRSSAALIAIRKFDVVDATRLHLDLTTVRFAGAYEDSSLVAKGWGADRRVARQIRAEQATTSNGISLYFRPHAGASAEVSVLSQALEQLSKDLPAAPLVVADSALGHLSNLCAAHRTGARFIVPLRANSGWLEHFTQEVGSLDKLHDLDYVSQREQRLPPDRRTQWRGLLRPWSVVDPVTEKPIDLHVAFIWSSEEAASVSTARQRALDKLCAALTRIGNGLGRRYYKTQEAVDRKIAQVVEPKLSNLIRISTGTDADGKPTLDWNLNQQALCEASRFDGLYALATNLCDPPGRSLTAQDVLVVYKDQWLVEQRHRDLKQTLRVRPVFLHNDDRILALASVLGLALLVFSLIEAELRARLQGKHTLPGLLPERRAAKPTGRNILNAFAGLGLTYTHRGIALDPLTSTQRMILDLLDIPLPWPQAPS
jgi:transposase